MYRPCAIASAGAASAGSALLLGSAVGARHLACEAAMGLLILGIAAASCYHFVTMRRSSQDLQAQLVQSEAWEAAVQGEPRLGELLVYRYHWIRKTDLDRALARQRQTGRMLGETLLDLRVISAVRLTHALREQRRLRYKGPLPEHEVNWAERDEAT